MGRPRVKVSYVTGSRADFGLMKHALRQINASSKLDLEVLICAQHFIKELGHTYKEVEREFKNALIAKDTFTIDTPAGISRAYIDVSLGFLKQFQRSKPDVLLVLGDRWEQHAASVVAAQLLIPIAHIHGGERTGTIDEMYRRSIERFASVHMSASKDASMRLKKMGEESFRLHTIGAPGLDEIRMHSKPSRQDLLQSMEMDHWQNYGVLIQHPVHSEYTESKKQIQASLSAIKKSNLPFVILAPNSDAGGKAMLEEIQSFAKKNTNIVVKNHLARNEFLSLLSHASVLVGNSSSGMIEAPFFKVPVVNIGSRQSSRLCSPHTLHCNHSAVGIEKSIRKCILDRSLHQKLSKDRFLYGNGRSSEKIVGLLETLNWNDPRMVKKCITY